MSVKTYDPHRDGRFYYAGDAIASIEASTCSLGCVHAGDRATRAEFGPGGNCGLLAAIFAEIKQDEILDHGSHLSCTARTPEDT